MAWLQLCMEQLHSKTPARASSGWSWSWLDGVFGMKVIPSSRKGDFEGELSFLPLVHGTHMSYSLALSLFAERPLELLSSCELYPSPLSSFSYRWAIPNPQASRGTPSSPAARCRRGRRRLLLLRRRHRSHQGCKSPHALASRWCHLRRLPRVSSRAVSTTVSTSGEGGTGGEGGEGEGRQGGRQRRGRRGGRRQW